MTADATPITHVVLFKYKPNISWEDFETHFDTFKSLRQRCIHPSTGQPYMLSMKMGKNQSWEGFHKGMTHAFVLEFASQADLDYYLLKDPVHLDFSRKAGPLIEDSCVVDIQDGKLFGSGFVKPGTEGGGKYRGRCHCKGMEWEVTSQERLTHVLCHCDTCKALGGGPYSCNFIVPQNSLRITRGKPGHYAYTGASGKQVHCYFCPTCTSHIYHHQDAMPENIIVRTLLLDGGSGFETGGEIFTEGRLAWVRDLEAKLPNGV